MCGRYASFRRSEDLAEEFGVATESIADDARLLPPSWNVAPTDAVRIVVEREPRGEDASTDDDDADAAPTPTVERSLRLARWGLVPSWAKDPKIGARMINARVESLAEKPAFRRALVARRCLVPAEGYFEWQAVEAAAGGSKRPPKQPWWIHDPEGGSLAFAGLFEFWRDPSVPDGEPHRWLVTTTVVTGGASTDDPALAAIHDRRPVVLPPDRWDAWLDPTLHDPAEAVALLHAPAPRLVARPVSTTVNKVGTNGPELVEPVEPVSPAPGPPGVPAG